MRSKNNNKYSINNKHYESLFINFRDGIYRSTPDGEYIDVNPALINMLGYNSKSKLLSQNIPEMICIAAEIDSLAPEKRDGIITTRLKKKDGTLIWVKVNSWVVRDDTGNILYYEGIVRNITERKKDKRNFYRTEGQLKTILKNIVIVFKDKTKKRKLTKKLKYSKEKYDSLFKNTGTGMAIIEKNTNICKINNQFKIITGYKKSEIEGKMSWEDLVIDISYYKNCRYDNKYELVLKDKDGKEKAVMGTVTVISGGRKNIVSLTDISKKKKIKERIKNLKYCDQLTGLYNKVFLKKALQSLDTGSQLPLSIIMGDINDLKSVNDDFGYEKGDELLKVTADIIKSCCRQKDIVARWGGDEFAVLLPTTDKKTTRKILDQINEKCERVKEGIVQPSVAFGLGTKVDKKQDLEEVLLQAENYVYKHKLVEATSARNSIIKSLEEILREKDDETQKHTDRLKNNALKLGKALDLPDNKLDELILLAALHDIGKIAIPDSILLKTGTFNAKEWETMKKHSEIGWRIVQAVPEFTPIAEGILHHHEWWNGTGYPDQLKGNDIPLIARIISIVDAYDVMMHDRPYKKALSKGEAIKELKRCAGIQFDPEIVDIFIEKVV